MFESHLIRSTRNLPPTLQIWVSIALRSGWFKFVAGTYENPASGHVCPIAAAGILAGVWVNGKPLPNNIDWGTAEGPSPEVEDFAAHFDLCADEVGVDSALHIVRESLAVRDLLSVAESDQAA